MTNRNRTQAVYVISVAAELAGMHPQTLRIYERRGLVNPARTQGGNRRYSDADIETLQRIAQLADQGMNLEGIRRVMELEYENARLRDELRTARQVAEKAKANPKEAAALFENGAVADWYKMNGWKYPVQGPAASGLGAVQQFFEALGLTPPPKVEINCRKIDLEGGPGERLRAAVELKTQEKRPIYGHATSSEPWLEVSRAKLAGRIASINMSVPSVPKALALRVRGRGMLPRSSSTL